MTHNLFIIRNSYVYKILTKPSKNEPQCKAVDLSYLQHTVSSWLKISGENIDERDNIDANET